MGDISVRPHYNPGMVHTGDMAGHSTSFDGTPDIGVSPHPIHPGGIGMQDLQAPTHESGRRPSMFNPPSEYPPAHTLYNPQWSAGTPAPGPGQHSMYTYSHGHHNTGIMGPGPQPAHNGLAVSPNHQYMLQTSSYEAYPRVSDTPGYQPPFEVPGPDGRRLHAHGGDPGVVITKAEAGQPLVMPQ